MASSTGPDIVTDGLVLALDAANYKSLLRNKQSSNILVDPNTWSLGTDSTTGYSRNGNANEQNRVYVTDDPWGGNSIVWRTTPDSTSGPDGGWNTSYYSIDTKYTYRWSVWVRRHTAGTGGTFYMGMNPNPIRNDNDSSQSNPYFTYPGISSLTQNQWYLVVGHCFYEGYDGGRHPDSGWYENGVKISDKSYGNVGTQDVRWASGTTSARHRAYHYYTTNVNSGIEFSYPRIDKCDGNEPTISDLINRGESKFRDMSGNGNDGLVFNGVGYDSGNGGSLIFDGVDDYVNYGNIFNDVFAGVDKKFTISSWVNYNALQQNGNVILSKLGDSIFNENQRQISFQVRNINYGSFELEFFAYFTLTVTNYAGYRTVNANIQTNQYYNFVVSYDGSIDGSGRYSLFVNGIQYNVTPTFTGGTWGDIQPGNARMSIGATIGEKVTNSPRSLLNGKIAKISIYNRALTASEIQQNFNATRIRFGI